jgi:excisionase family DNA binding protein
MRIPRNVSEFRKWLRAEIAALDNPPEDPLPICEDAARALKNARRIAIALELPDVAKVCEKVTTPALALPIAQRLLTKCLTLLPADTLTVKEAAQRLKVSERTVYDLVRSGRLHAQRVGKGRGAIRIAPADLANIGQPTRRLRHL